MFLSLLLLLYQILSVPGVQRVNINNKQKKFRNDVKSLVLKYSKKMSEIYKHVSFSTKDLIQVTNCN